MTLMISYIFAFVKTPEYKKYSKKPYDYAVYLDILVFLCYTDAISLCLLNRLLLAPFERLMLEI